MYVTGRLKLDWANVDAGELFGWFNSATACDQSTGGKGHGLPDKFLGVTIAAGVLQVTVDGVVYQVFSKNNLDWVWIGNGLRGI